MGSAPRESKPRSRKVLNQNGKKCLSHDPPLRRPLHGGAWARNAEFHINVLAQGVGRGGLEAFTAALSRKLLVLMWFSPGGLPAKALHGPVIGPER